MSFKDYVLKYQEDEIKVAAQIIFGDNISKAESYVAHLVTSGIERGLLGPREISRIWDRHVLNCAVIQERIPKDILVADVGSGAGLPGLTLAIARPDLKVILIEPLKRRVVWLEEVINDLELGNVDIFPFRAEEVKNAVVADIVTARAVSSLKNLINICFPLLGNINEFPERNKGKDISKLIAIKGISVAEEIKVAEKVLNKRKLKASIRILGEDILTEPTRIVEIFR